MTSPDQLFQSAIAHHQAGRLPEAERLYRQLLQVQPLHADAIHLLGVIAHQVGKHERAMEYIERAISLNPGAPAYYSNLGEALRKLGRLELALAKYDRAIGLLPHYADAHSNRGAALLDLKRPAEAEQSCRAALAANPQHVDAWNNLGNAQRELGRVEEAETSYRRAVALNPNYALAPNNLGVLCQEQGRLDEALTYFQRALRLNPNYAEAHNGLANTLKEFARYEEALPHYRRALELEPTRAEFQMNLSLVLLMLEQFEEGWQEYEWRRHTFLFRPRNYSQPLWTGEENSQATLLLYAEQGFGDTIQFIRYAPQVRQRVGRIVVECQKQLIPLLKNFPGVDQWVAKGEALPEFDVYNSLLSLPGIFRSTPETLPAEVPYLSVRTDRVEHWRERLATLPGLKVGLNWQGNPKFRTDHSRSIPLAKFAPLAEVGGVSFVSLQYGAGREQLADWPGELLDLGSEMDDSLGAFVDSAAIMQNLDLIITTDTAPAHLAGALGRKCWVILPLVPDWRWLRERTDTPWYRTLELFRPQEAKGWELPIEKVAHKLALQVR